MKKIWFLWIGMVVFLGFALPQTNAETSADNTSGEATVVIYFYDDGIELKSVTIKKDTSVELFTPTKKNYTFSHWEFVDENNKAVTATNETTYKTNTVLRAYWKPSANTEAYPNAGKPMESPVKEKVEVTSVIKKIKVKKGKVQVTLKKNANATHYILKYSTNKDFLSCKTKKSTKPVFTIKGLKKGKTYYLKAEMNMDKTKYNVKESKVKKVKTKK